MDRPGLKRRVAELRKGIVKEWSTFWTTTIGTVLMSFAIVALTMPYRLPSTGVTGFALLSNYIWGISPAWVIAFGNVGLLIWGWHQLSPRFVLWTLYVVALSALSVKFFEIFTYPVIGETLLAAILGGVLGGLGMGLILRVGASTGGTDVIVMSMKKRYGVDVGMYSFYINISILLMSYFIVGLEQVLFGGVLLYVESITVDSVMKSFDRRKQMLIITSIPEEAKHFILDILDKSASIMQAEGAYSGEVRPMLMVVLTRRQSVELKRFVVERDPAAFIVVSDVAEVVGEGFKHWKSI